MLTGVHFLLTYNCNYECDHCFLYCGPKAMGTFTVGLLRGAFDQIAAIKTIEWIYFEGGEAFLYYPLMLEGLKIARDMGLKTGVVTNSYWALSEEDAELWLKPLCELGVSNLTVSDDLFHCEDEKNSPAKKAISAGKKLGMPLSSITIEKTTADTETKKLKGTPIVGNEALLKGRAVEKLVEGLPKQSYDKFIECSDEDLRNPGRVHIDPFGYVHLCQGVVMGNIWDTPLSELVENYNAELHPICGPLLKGGPALLAETYNLEHDDEYVSACHFCYLMRLALLDKFPKYLAPRQVYGLE